MKSKSVQHSNKNMNIH